MRLDPVVINVIDDELGHTPDRCVEYYVVDVVGIVDHLPFSVLVTIQIAMHHPGGEIISFARGCVYCNWCTIMLDIGKGGTTGKIKIHGSGVRDGSL